MAITQDVNSKQKMIQIAIDQRNDTGTSSVAVKHLSCIRVDNLQALGCTEVAIDQHNVTVTTSVAVKHLSIIM